MNILFGNKIYKYTYLCKDILKAQYDITVAAEAAVGKVAPWDKSWTAWIAGVFLIYKKVQLAADMCRSLKSEWSEQQSIFLLQLYLNMFGTYLNVLH